MKKLFAIAFFILLASFAYAQQNTGSQSKILIAYFTWADNVAVANPTVVNVDATSSASVTAPGNVGLLARWIAEATGGDIFQIIVTESYSSDYETSLARARNELAKQARPKLARKISNIDDYDVIFLGYPTWVGTNPMAASTFLEEYDFKGKIIIPFSAYGTSGFGNSISDIEKKLPDSEILKPFGVYRPNVTSAKNDLNKWLAELNYKK